MKTLGLVLLMAFAVGCAGSPMKRCMKNTDGMAKLGCAAPLIPVVNAVLPDGAERAAD